VEVDAMSVVDCREAAIDREVLDLLAELAGSVPAEVVRDVVSAVRKDLLGQVPMEALPEFLHRSALQRLVDCKGLACDSEL
jgi:hypothetical protein